MIVPTRTFAGTASAVVQIGATPVFADIDAHTQGLARATVEPHLGPRTRAIIAVHLGGWPCAMGPLAALAQQRGVVLMEDCAQAHGARLGDALVGGLGQIATFSMCQDKIISTGGEGGMIITDDIALAQRAWSLKDHGKDYAAVHSPSHAPGFRWLHEHPGTNARLTEMQAVLGLEQLAQLPAWVQTRRRHAARLAAGLHDIAALSIPRPSDDEQPAYYRFYAFVQPDRLRPEWTRTRVMEAIAAEGIPCTVGSCGEVHHERAFAAYRPQQPLPVAARLGATSLAWLVHPTMTDADIDDTVAATTKVFAEATA